MSNHNDRLLKADDVSLVAKAERDGKIRVTSKSWDEAVVLLPIRCSSCVMTWSRSSFCVSRGCRTTATRRPMRMTQDFDYVSDASPADVTRDGNGATGMPLQK